MSKSIPHNNQKRKIIKAAEGYANSGLPLVPLRGREDNNHDNAKRPANRNGVTGATASWKSLKPLLIAQKLPNIALATGEISQVLCLDVDPRNGGRETMKQLKEDLGKLPKTWKSKTGGGGYHLFFKMPHVNISKDNHGKLLGNGVDVLGSGAYAVLPPSIHPNGKQYEWYEGLDNMTPIAELPERWVQRIVSNQKPGHPIDKPLVEQKTDTVGAIHEGSRNQKLTQIGGKLQRSGLTEEELYSALIAINASRCVPPLSSDEVRKISQSLSRYSTMGKAVSVDLADRIADQILSEMYQNGEKLKFLPDGNFWEYAGKRWCVIEETQLKSIVLSVIKSSFLDGRRSYSPLTREIVELMKIKQSTKDDPLHFNTPLPPVINLANGELWLLDGGKVELRAHSASSGLRHFIDVPYLEDAEAPEYEQAVKEIFSCSEDPEKMTKFWYELMGYVIQPNRKHPFIGILLGEGSNGKTKLIQTFTRLLGDETVYAGRIDELEHDRFAVGNLFGKFLFVDDDVQAGTKLPDGILKKISEEKTITGEQKFKNKFTFTCRVVPLLLCNNVPSLPDLSKGMRRRLHIIPFNRSFTGQNDDKDLFSRIWKKEMPGILRLAVKGWERLEKRGHFKVPMDMDVAFKKWMAQANPLENFVDEACERDPKAKILLVELYDGFCTWAKDAGITRFQQRTTFKANLHHLGFNVKRGNKGLQVHGIKIIHKTTPRIAHRTL